MKIRVAFWLSLGAAACVVGTLLLSRVLESQLIDLLGQVLARHPSEQTGPRLQMLGAIALTTGVCLVLAVLLRRRIQQLRTQGFVRRLRSLEARLAGRLDPVVSLADQTMLNRQTSPAAGTIGWRDVAVSTGFLVFALLFTLSRIQPSFPHVALRGDAANIASFAAALDHPDLFAADPLLGDPANFRIYLVLHVALVRWLAGLLGNYGIAVAVLLGPAILLHLLGYYLLGRVAFGSRYWAFMLAIATLMPFPMVLDEHWGVLPDALPRFLFEGLLPLLLSLVWLWRTQPLRWPWLAALSGLLVYVHPVSAPAWLFAIWLSLWLFLPERWSARRRWPFMIALGVLALAAASPFVLNYLSHHVQGTSPGYDLVYYIIENHFPAFLLDPPRALGVLLAQAEALLLLSGIALLGLLVLLRADRASLRMVLAWLFGLLVMSVLVPWIEHGIERYLRIIPVETELARGLRYLIFLMLFLCVWCLSELQRRLRQGWAKPAVFLVGALLVGAYTAAHPPYPEMLAAELKCLGVGRIMCPEESAYAQALRSVQEQVPPNGTVFVYLASNDSPYAGIEIRYLALHPLAYAYKDRGLLVYSNEQALRRWFTTYQTMRQLGSFPLPDQLERLLDLSREYQARYLLMDQKPEPADLAALGLRTLFESREYLLLEVTPH